MGKWFEMIRDNSLVLRTLFAAHSRTNSFESAESHQRDIKGNSRSRSNTATSTKSRKRPQSRASTTSAHSVAPQSMSGQHMVQHSAEHQKHWYEQSSHVPPPQRFGSMSHQMTPEQMVANSASQLQNPRQYEIDPALEVQHTHPPIDYPEDGTYITDHRRQSLPVEYGPAYGEDSQIMEGRSDEQDEVESLAGATGPAKKASKSSAANELEMRQLFQSNKHRTLPEVATGLHGNERGPQSERQRQVFAMLW